MIKVEFQTILGPSIARVDGDTWTVLEGIHHEQFEYLLNLCFGPDWKVTPGYWPDAALPRALAAMELFEPATIIEQTLPASDPGVVY